MRQMMRRLIVLGIGAIMLAAPLVAQQRLRYKFDPGKQYRYETSMENKTNGHGMGQDFSVSYQSYLTYTVYVEDYRYGMFSLLITLEKFVNRIHMPMLGYRDSTVVMKEWEGKRVKVVMDDYGRTVSSQAVDSISPSSLGPMVQLGPADMFRHIFFELPEKNVGIDSSWRKFETDTAAQMGLQLIIKPNIDFLIASTEPQEGYPCWKISFGGTTTTSGAGSIQGTDIAVDGSTKIAGTAYFAPTEGLLIAADQTNDSEMTQTFSGAQIGSQTVASVAVIKSTLKK
jgi:hypothetical protein